MMLLFVTVIGKMSMHFWMFKKEITEKKKKTRSVTLKKKQFSKGIGGSGFRSPCLTDANGALYQLS